MNDGTVNTLSPLPTISIRERAEDRPIAIVRPPIVARARRVAATLAAAAGVVIGLLGVIDIAGVSGDGRSWPSIQGQIAEPREISMPAADLDMSLIQAQALPLPGGAAPVEAPLQSDPAPVTPKVESAPPQPSAAVTPTDSGYHAVGGVVEEGFAHLVKIMNISFYVLGFGLMAMGLMSIFRAANDGQGGMAQGLMMTTMGCVMPALPKFLMSLLGL